MQLEWVKIGDFRQIAGYISKTVQDRRMVSLKSNRKSYALYRMVALLMTLRLECPLTAPNHPIFAFCTVLHRFVTDEHTDFKFVH